MDVRDYEVAKYLVAMADNKGGEKKTSDANTLTGNETLEEIFSKAVGLERDSIMFYTGLKHLVPTKDGQNWIDEIIREKQRRVVRLSNLFEKSKTN